VGSSTPVGEALAALAATPHSRFPVVGPDDDVTGIVHLRDLFAEARDRPGTLVAEVTRPLLAVPEVLTVPGLWDALREDGRHAALVVNEFGSVSGMVTLEDALEEILGEVRDEFDEEEDPITEADGRVVVRGDVLVEVLVDRFGLDLEAGRVETIGGLVWHSLGRFPEVGDHVVLEPGGLEVRVDALDGRAVARASFERPGGPS
jgi:CBS domain containing-hemolysin-like protein